MLLLQYISNDVAIILIHKQMKKPSIATTVDEESNHITRPFEKRYNMLVKEVGEEFIEINKGTNWMYLIIGVAYIMECG